MPEISLFTLIFVAAFAAMYLYIGICIFRMMYLTTGNQEATELYLAYVTGNRTAVFVASVFYLTWPAWMVVGYLNAKRLDYLEARERRQ